MLNDKKQYWVRSSVGSIDPETELYTLPADCDNNKFKLSIQARMMQRMEEIEEITLKLRTGKYDNLEFNRIIKLNNLNYEDLKRLC